MHRKWGLSGAARRESTPGWVSVRSPGLGVVKGTASQGRVTPSPAAPCARGAAARPSGDPVFSVRPTAGSAGGGVTDPGGGWGGTVISQLRGGRRGRAARRSVKSPPGLILVTTFHWLPPPAASAGPARPWPLRRAPCARSREKVTGAGCPGGGGLGGRPAERGADLGRVEGPFDPGLLPPPPQASQFV